MHILRILHMFWIMEKFGDLGGQSRMTSIFPESHSAADFAK
jgi:hypothetical protein